MADESRTPLIDLELAKRLHKALTASSGELFQVLTDPDMQVLRSTFKNQNINEDHLLTLLKRRDLTEELLKSIYQLDISKRSHRLQVALVKNPGTPGPVALALLPFLHLFELVDLCIIPGVTPDQKFGAERAILQRLPTTELGNKMTLARRATATVVGAILKEGNARLVEICLGSPRLREVDILQFINSAVRQDFARLHIPFAAEIIRRLFNPKAKLGCCCLHDLDRFNGHFRAGSVTAHYANLIRLHSVFPFLYSC